MAQPFGGPGVAPPGGHARRKSQRTTNRPVATPAWGGSAPPSSIIRTQDHPTPAATTDGTSVTSSPNVVSPSVARVEG